MEHFYNNVSGFFNFQDVYSDMVKHFPTNSHFVELGTFLGCSAVYMSVEIINSEKNIKFDCIDKWDFKWTYPNGKVVDVYDEFQENIKPVQDFINPIRGFSKDIVNNYDDESIDFLFIDADHEYEGVKNDITLWFPKVKKGGIIAGHDYVDSFPGVIKAVDEFFETVRISETSWIYEK